MDGAEVTERQGRRWARTIARDLANTEPDDFYPTVPAGTEALLAVEQFDGPIWECACGDGAMSRALSAAGYEVESTDLIDRGFGTGGVDFLLETEKSVPNIVTNPPFKLWTRWFWHSLARAERKVALLGRIACLEGIERRALFEDSPLARVWVFSDRLPMQRGRLPIEGDRRGLIAFAWFVWEHGHSGPPVLGWVTPGGVLPPPFDWDDVWDSRGEIIIDVVD